MGKGQGAVNDIIYYLQEMYFGDHYFEVAMLFRNAYFLSVVTNDSEIWSNTLKQDMDKLEALDTQLLRRVFETNSKASRALIML